VKAVVSMDAPYHRVVELPRPFPPVRGDSF
jgi:hypothetical protein